MINVLYSFERGSELEYISTLTLNWVPRNKLRRIYKHFMTVKSLNPGVISKVG